MTISVNGCRGLSNWEAISELDEMMNGRNGYVQTFLFIKETHCDCDPEFAAKAMSWLLKNNH